MASSTIDVLLQATTAPRGVEAAPRAGDGTAPFKPALEQALAEKPPATVSTNAAPEENEPAPDVTDPHAESRDTSEDDEGQASAVDAATAPASVDDDAASEEDSDGDAVEISELAAAAAVVVATKADASQAEAASGAAQVDEISPVVAKNKPGASDQNADAGATDSDPTSAAAAAQNLEAQPVDELAAGQDGAAKGRATGAAKKAPPIEKSNAKRGDEQSTNDDALRLTGADGGAISQQPVDAAANDVSDEPLNEKQDDGDNGVREAKQSSGGRADAKQAEVVVAPVATTDAVAAVVDAAASPANEQSTGDGVAKTTPDSAASAAASRSTAALERLTATRGVRPGGSTSDTESTPQVDPARFVSRVEGAMRTAHQRDGRVQVRLSPPELGALRIELQMHAGGLTAHIEAETASARKLLLDNLPALRERLAQQDIRVEKFEVDVRRDGGQPSGGGPQDRQADQPTRQSHDERSRPAPRSAAAPARSVAPAAAAISDAGLDVRI